MPVFNRRRFLQGAGVGFSAGLLWPLSGLAQDGPRGASALHAGPMQGYPAVRSAQLWLQTLGPARIQVAFWPEGREEARRLTEIVATKAQTQFTALLTLDDLAPGTRYATQVLLDGQALATSPLTVRTLSLWQWRRPAPDFKVLAGSCAYINDPVYDRPGKPYGGGYEIYQPMAAEKADLMVWLGDNLYFREADTLSPAGMALRYWQDRAFAPLQQFLGSAPQVAIWDDHDYGPNDSDASFEFKSTALNLFRNHWANPGYGLPGTPGVFTVVHLYDADFFLLDDRWYRDADAAPARRGKVMFGPQQMTWLKNALLSSKARFKIIAAGGQMLNDDDAYEGWNHYPEERQDFLDWLQETGIKGVLFLSGDRHISELMRRPRPQYSGRHDYPLFELTSSPINSGPGRGDANPYRIPGTLVKARNYCSMEFLGAGKDRYLRIRCLDSQGKRLWEQQIAGADLGYA